jgi:putative heme iron utilization protein
MNNQTLVFDTTEKKAFLFQGLVKNDEIVYEFKDVPTVKVENGYYEVMQKSGENGGVVPVLRVPIANTNMLIQK